MIRRNTNQRQIVYEAIDYLGHVTSEDLIKYINNNYTDISLATIYRNLSILMEEHLVKKIKLQNCEVYETVKAKHCHFICRCCGNVIDITPSELGVDLEQIKKVDGNIVDEYELNMYGLCSKCKNE